MKGFTLTNLIVYSAKERLTVSGDVRSCEGLMSALLEDVHLCSMGEGAGTPSSSIRLRSSACNQRLKMLMFLVYPVLLKGLRC